MRRLVEILASSQCQAQLPQLEMVAIRDKRTGDEFNVKLMGFDYSCAMLMDATKQSVAKAPYYGFLEIIFDGDHVVTLDSLWSTVQRERAPLLSAVVVQETRDESMLPLNEIKVIHVPVKKNGKIVGLLTGATLDAVVIIVAASSINPVGGLELNF